MIVGDGLLPSGPVAVRLRAMKTGAIAIIGCCIIR
jgi:hypothetical protein